MEPEASKNIQTTAKKEKSPVIARSDHDPANPTDPPKRETTAAKRRRRRLQDMVENYELVSLICHLHVSGATVKEILQEVKDKFRRVEMKREDPSWITRWAARQGWLTFRPPHHEAYRQQIRELWPQLMDAEVVSSTEVEVVAREGAKMLIRMLRKLSATKDTVHVGVAGGHTIRAVMRALAAEMVEPISNMPKVVHFHAMAAGFDPDDPSTDPNAFVTFFDNRLVPTEIRFTGLSAPALVSPETFEKLKDFEDIKDAFESVKNIDVFLTSGTSWHGDGVLRKRMGESDQAILVSKNVVGDIHWRPISRQGPITEETARRAFTLVELEQIIEFVKEGKQVLLTLAPCGSCGELKGNLMRCILDQQIATHVVFDTRSAGQMLGKVANG
jgi:DNA-binding transcriptional regulator LsrR (DeoR family)